MQRIATAGDGVFSQLTDTLTTIESQNSLFQFYHGHHTLGLYNFIKYSSFQSN